MPHITVKLWPGKPEEAKERLAEQIVASAMETLGYDEGALSVSFEEVEPSEWKEKVYIPEIINKEKQVYKKPGYKM